MDTADIRHPNHVREDASERLNISLQPSVLRAVRALAIREDRPMSQMARILMAEGLAARAEDASA